MHVRGALRMAWIICVERLLAEDPDAAAVGQLLRAQAVRLDYNKLVGLDRRKSRLSAFDDGSHGFAKERSDPGALVPAPMLRNA